MTTSTAKGSKVYLTHVDQWLDTLPASESEEFKEFADGTEGYRQLGQEYKAALKDSEYSK